MASYPGRSTAGSAPLRPPATDRRASVATPIDDYLRLLDGRLRGPARLKADLLAEARGSLEDAAEAYAETGLDRQSAQRRAVADFGEPADLAPAYQAELTAGQGRRLALALTLLPVSMLTADLMWWEPPAETRETPPPLFLLLAEALMAAAGPRAVAR